MNKSTLTNYLNTITKIVKKHSPEILTGLGIAGMITSTVLAVKATPRALELIEAEKKRQNDELLEDALNSHKDECLHIDRLKPLDVVKVAWKPYIPSVLLSGGSVACLIAANSVNVRRQAALYSAYKLSENALEEYKEKIKETVGEKKAAAIEDKVAKDTVDKNPVSKSEVIITGGGTTLFLEPWSGRYFESDIESVRKAINDLNFEMGFGSEPYISLDQFYDKLNIAHTQGSSLVGWSIKDGQIEANYSSQITDDGRAAIVINWLKLPGPGFDDLY